MTNKEILQRAFEGTAKGDGRAFVDTFADDVRWSIIGSTSWSRTFAGKAAVIASLLRPLAAEFSGPNLVSAERIIGEGDIVVVEASNHSVTRSGAAYPNRYCFIFVFKAGKVAEITEYCDTDLVARVLSPLPSIPTA